MQLKHSGLGIASSVVFIVGSIALLLLCVIAGVVGGMDEEYELALYERALKFEELKATDRLEEWDAICEENGWPNENPGTPRERNYDSSLDTILIGLFVFASLVVSFVALGLGVAGLLQKDRNKTFAIVGIAISAVAFLGTLFLLIVGLAMG